MKIITAALVRNESLRWLDEFMAQARYLSDYVVVMDDCSDDDTADIARRYADEVIVNETSRFVSAENELRSSLWQAATKYARTGDWMLLFDADDLLSSDDQDQLKFLLNHQRLPGVDALGFRLLDMWSPTHYRDDQFWQAHNGLTIRAVRYDATAPQLFADKAHHCGSFPVGAATNLANSGVTIRHMGWSREADRLAKFERYMQADPHGEFGWLEQYRSILDEQPRLLPA